MMMMTTIDPIDQALDELYGDGPSDDETEQAVSNLIARLDQELPSIAHYSRIPQTPLGPIWLAMTADGVVAIEYEMPEADFIAFATKKVKLRMRRNDKALTEAMAEVKAYLKGERTYFNLPVDMRLLSEFQKIVLTCALEVPRGQVSTYGDIAKQIGKPNAMRAVGQALRHNPIPILLPCHRVIAADGSIGGYGGKVDDPRKSILLRIEGATLV